MIGLLLAGLAALPAAGRAVALPEAVYRVDLAASYDPATRQISGRERLRWRNTSSVPLSELRFHLYLNAFADNRSSLVEESGADVRGRPIEADGWGWIEVRSMRLPGGVDLAPLGSFVSPDDGNPEDRTVARYPLPEALAPGGWISLDIEFTSHLPHVYSRTGAEGDFVLAGQWFPKIGVFEDAGVRGRAAAGWSCQQLHADSEFYADFGDWSVTLTLPLRYRGKIGATGALAEETVAGDQVTVRFEQRGVHDFAWSADPAFVVRHDRFDPATDVPPDLAARVAAQLGRDPSELALPPIEITLLLPPADLPQAGRFLAAAKAAIADLGLRLGPYPYATLTMIDPPAGAENAGGMEYPTFITLGTGPLLTLPPFRGIRLPELVAIHEYGHQYWYGMVASNEAEESWLDEGINSYYESLITEDFYGGDFARFLGLRVPMIELHHASLDGGHYTDPVDRASWRFLSEHSYFVNSYARPAVTLRHLENLVGSERFHRAMRAVFEQLRFHHPATADFEAGFAAAVGEDLGWFFRQALHSTRKLDYAVSKVETEQPPAAEGHLAASDAAQAEPAAGKTAGPAERRPWRSTVVVERRGDFVHPVEVEMRFADGTALRRRWAGARRWARWRLTTSSPLVSAEVDPDRRMILDVDRLDNGRTVEAARAPRYKLLAHLLFWLQKLFASTSLFG